MDIYALQAAFLPFGPSGLVKCAESSGQNALKDVQDGRVEWLLVTYARVLGVERRRA